MFLEENNTWIGEADCPPPMWVGLTKPVEDQNGTKLLSLLSEREFLPLYYLQPGTSAFPCLQTRSETLAPPGSQACWLMNWSYVISSPGFNSKAGLCAEEDVSVQREKGSWDERRIHWERKGGYIPDLPKSFCTYHQLHILYSVSLWPSAKL